MAGFKSALHLQIRRMAWMHHRVATSDKRISQLPDLDQSNDQRLLREGGFETRPYLRVVM
jgi:hypothetical protein